MPLQFCSRHGRPGIPLQIYNYAWPSCLTDQFRWSFVTLPARPTVPLQFHDLLFPNSPRGKVLASCYNGCALFGAPLSAWGTLVFRVRAISILLTSLACVAHNVLIFVRFYPYYMYYIYERTGLSKTQGGVNKCNCFPNDDL